MRTKQHKAANKLINETSPYLQQHAHNPVDWYPWGEEAFTKAREEDKPIFLSIGYSTCHWCHVMEEESFEDEEVSHLLNKDFVAIKVDREERPDIDGLYMQVAQMMTGRGGWPLTIVMTPDKEPFFAATYIPKKSHHSRLGMVDLLPRLAEIYESDNEKVESTIAKVKTRLNQMQQGVSSEIPEMSIVDTTTGELSSRFDEKHGGFGGAPKFPSAQNLMLLLRSWKDSGDEWQLHMVKKTLQGMRKGGIYDQIGFGFHRYSTDKEWLIPHFEKMLYDQAMLVYALVETYQATKDRYYADTAAETIEYVLREMTSEEGGFFSAQDADSEGEEGKYYIWSIDEVESVLDKQEFEVATKLYGIQEKGNFLDEATRKKTGKNILHVNKESKEVAKELGIDENEIQDTIQSINTKLLRRRKERVAPLTDDKILVDWNGLMIAAMAKAGRVLNNSKYLEAARKAADFILKEMRTEERGLYHRYRESEADIDAYSTDYAFLVWGLIELYESTFDPNYLSISKQLLTFLETHFWDDDNGGFYLSADFSEDLMVRQKPAFDGSLPSANSVAAYVFLRLARLLGNYELENVAEEILSAFGKQIETRPTSHTMMLVALEYLRGVSREVVLVGTRNSQDLQAMISALQQEFLPSVSVLVKDDESISEKLASVAPFTEHFDSVNKQATAHVCIDQNCKLPTTNLDEMLSSVRVE
ncbi:MAG: thioredoxin domain-containing protein [Candidatus Thorarchaeota archaeon]|nr:thioredoxin domain-containing protein [Candidatus Thorarchaeota archaeon]